MPAKTPSIDSTTEQKILGAARKVFLTRGMMGARMQEIADEAGINKALLHYYFRNKEQLFERTFLEAAGQLFPRIKQLFESDADLFELITHFCDEYIGVLSQHPHMPLFLFNEINRDPHAFMKKIHTTVGFPDAGLFVKKVQKEIRKGTIKKVKPHQLLMNMLSMCIFPFVAGPMIRINMQLDEKQFRQAVEQRKKEVPEFIFAAIKK